ncbi:hypothetical protein AB0M45_30470 [Nocardia sp. NPDC051787]|uniref:hypothetical protein n=1 Tax=Nocardia sp. NPDC051787 TaxID=3155415 RepID=UPI003437DD32
MTIDGMIVPLLIASPGDVAAERDVVERVVHEWNATHSTESGVVLLPLRWEMNAISDLHLDPQEAINDQLVRFADIVVVLFSARLGTPTPRALSGTVEELDQAIRNGVRVHGFFNGGPLPPDSQLDLEQLASLRKFKNEWKRRGLWSEYVDLEALSVSVMRTISRDVSLLTKERRVGAGVGSSAKFSVEYHLDGDKSVGAATSYAHVELCNVSAYTAEAVRFEILADDDRMPPISGLQMHDSNLAPGERVIVPLYPSFAMSESIRILIRWREGLRSFEVSVPLTRSRG